MATDKLGFITGVRLMTCAKYDGDPPRPTRLRVFLRRLGFKIADAPFKMPAEIVVTGDGIPTRRIIPTRDGLTKAEVIRLLTHSAD